MTGQSGRTLRPEDEIGHYRIVSPLGVGGMGEVYLAQDRSLERRVALKVLPHDLVTNDERVRRFELEAKSASSLSHPNIVTIYEIGRGAVRSPGSPDSTPVHYISMELVSGKTLSTLIHEDRTDIRTLLGYLAQAAEGIAKAHAAGIVHRDLKPGNIMVSADGFAKVLDFGLAKLTEKRELPTETSEAPTRAVGGSEAGVVFGTAGYMSPEQVRGRTVDHRSDIFSFGCILYETATRRRPFEAETGVETMHKVLNEKPLPVEEINEQVPIELRRLIRRCLVKNPDQRVQSIKDLAIELREIVEEYDTLSVSASSAGRSVVAAPTPKLARLPGLLLIVGAVVVGVGGLVVGWWGLWRGGAGREPPRPFQSMRMSTQTSRGDVLESVLSRDGRYLAYLAGDAGRASLRVRQVATGSDVEVLPTTDAGLEGPSFSPDGNYLFYLVRVAGKANYRALYQIPSLGGSPRERAFDVDSRVTCSPDGKQVAFWRGVPQKRAAELVARDLEAQREHVVTTVGEPEFQQGAPAWSPDGEKIAALLIKPAPDLQTTLVLIDAATGRRQDILALPRTLLSSVAWLQDGRGLVAAGQDLRSAINDQVFLISYPEARLQRITNDFYRYSGVTVSGGEEAIAAVRLSRLADLWLADAAAGSARQLTSITNPEDSPLSVTVAGRDSIVFAAPLDQGVQLWAMEAAGGGARMVTSGTALSVRPQGATDVVVFGRLDTTGIHLWRMAPDGGGLRQLTKGRGEQVAAISPDGRFAAFTPYDSLRTVSLLSVDSGQTTPLSAAADSVAGFSPDGRRLLVAQVETDSEGLVQTVWKVLAVPGGEPVETYRLPGTAMDPTWGPPEGGLVFRDRADPAWNVYRQDAPGKAPQPITQFKEGRLVGHFWSPDGTKLAVIQRSDGSDNVWVTARDGARPVRVARFPAMDVFSLHWFRDSRRIVVSAGRLSRDAVLIRSFR